MIRELFHELPAYLFDVLKGIGEAVIEAATPAPAPIPRADPLASGPFLRLIADRTGADLVEFRRREWDRVSEFWLRWPCGHWTTTRISEQEMELAESVPHLVYGRLLTTVHQCSGACARRSGLPTGRREPSDPT